MKEEILQCRVVMRGALATGGRLWTPIILSVGDPKQNEILTRVAPADSKASGVDSAAANQTSTRKVSQTY